MKAGTLAKVSQGSGRWAPNMDGGQPMLKLRPSGLSSPAYRDWLDYVIVEDSRDVGRIYEDRSQQARAAVVLVDHGVPQSQAGHHDQRARVKP
jgi:hypothetical protein